MKPNRAHLLPSANRANEGLQSIRLPLKRKLDLTEDAVSDKHQKFDIIPLELLFMMTSRQRNEEVIDLNIVSDDANIFLECLDRFIIRLLVKLKNRSSNNKEINLKINWKQKPWFFGIVELYIEYYLVRYFSSSVKKEKFTYYNKQYQYTAVGQLIIKNMNKISLWPKKLSGLEVQIDREIDNSLNFSKNIDLLSEHSRNILIKDTRILFKRLDRDFLENEKSSMIFFYESLENFLLNKPNDELINLKFQEILSRTKLEVDVFKKILWNEVKTEERINLYHIKLIHAFYIERILLIKSIANKLNVYDFDIPKMHYDESGFSNLGMFSFANNMIIENLSDIKFLLKNFLTDNEIEKLKYKINFCYTCIDEKVNEIIEDDFIENNKKINLIRKKTEKTLDERIIKFFSNKKSEILFILSQYYLEQKVLMLDKKYEIYFSNENNLSYFCLDGKPKISGLIDLNEKIRKNNIREFILNTYRNLNANAIEVEHHETTEAVACEPLVDPLHENQVFKEKLNKLEIDLSKIENDDLIEQQDNFDAPNWLFGIKSADLEKYRWDINDLIGGTNQTLDVIPFDSFGDF